MTSMALLEDIVTRADGEKELMEARPSPLRPARAHARPEPSQPPCSHPPKARLLSPPSLHTPHPHILHTLIQALKEMGIKKMGHRQTIVGAVLGKL